MNRSHARWRGETGAELIEFAFILPVLLLVIGGIIDFGLLFWRFEVVTNAAREGARLGVLPDYGIDDVQQRTASYLVASGLQETAPLADVVFSEVELSPGGPLISVVSVTVSYPQNFLVLPTLATLVSGGAYDGFDLRATSTMRVESAAAAP